MIPSVGRIVHYTLNEQDAPTDWIGANGKAPNGFDIAKLEAALAADVAVKPQAVPEKLTVGA